MRVILASAAAAAFLFAIPAGAIAYSTGNATFSDLAQQPGGDGISDQLALAGTSGTITGPGIYDLNGVTFTVGYTGPNYVTESGTFNDTVTIGANTYTYGISYTLNSTYTDILTLGGNSAMLGDYLVTVNPLTLVGGYDVATGTFYSPDPATLTFTVADAGAVPEPATWAMMVAGLGLVGAGLRSRNGRMVQAI